MDAGVFLVHASELTVNRREVVCHILHICQQKLLNLEDYRVIRKCFFRLKPNSGNPDGNCLRADQVSFRVTVKLLLLLVFFLILSPPCCLFCPDLGPPASCCGIPEAPGAPGSFFPSSPTSTGKPPDCRPNTSTDSSSPSLSDAARGPSRLRLASTAGLGNT